MSTEIIDRDNFREKVCREGIPRALRTAIYVGAL
jgi:hypothetical protein